MRVGGDCSLQGDLALECWTHFGSQTPGPGDFDVSSGTRGS